MADLRLCADQVEMSRLSVASLIPYEQFIVVRNWIPLAVGSIAGNSENVLPSQSDEDLDHQAPSLNTTRICQRPQFSIPSAVCGVSGGPGRGGVRGTLQTANLVEILLPNLLPLPRKGSLKQDEPRPNRMDYVIEI